MQVYVKKVQYLRQKIWIFEKKVLSLQRISRIEELANSYQADRGITEG